MGKREYSSLAYRLGLTPGGMRTAGPLFAQHTTDVLTGLLGLSDSDIDPLVREDVVFLRPKVNAAA